MQGICGFRSLTPLERPKDMIDKDNVLAEHTAV
jgi:hypothetical protein